MAARFSDQLSDRDRIVERGDVLRTWAAELAESDACSYMAVLSAYRLPRDDAEHRRGQIRAALETAAEVPLCIVACAHEVGGLGMRVVAEGNPNLRGDVVTAVNLTEAGARSAAYLVQLNVRLGDLPEDRVVQAQRWCAELGDAVRSLEGSS